MSKIILIINMISSELIYSKFFSFYLRITGYRWKKCLELGDVPFGYLIIEIWASIFWVEGVKDMFWSARESCLHVV